MTVLARGVDRLKPRERLILFRHFLVTSGAWYFLVGAVKFESGVAVVIKLVGAPVRGAVAMPAIGERWSAIDAGDLGKLPTMNVSMTALATDINLGQHKVLLFRSHSLFMAAPAGYLPMLAVENKRRLRMIEADGPPALDRMAVLATAHGNVFFHLPGMWVAMTVVASRRSENKTRALDAVGSLESRVATDAGDG